MEAKDRIVDSQCMIPPSTIHSPQERPSIGVIFSYPHRSKDIVVLSLVVDNVQVSVSPCSRRPLFQTNIRLKKIIYSG